MVRHARRLRGLAVSLPEEVHASSRGRVTLADWPPIKAALEGLLSLKVRGTATRCGLAGRQAPRRALWGKGAGRCAGGAGLLLQDPLPRLPCSQALYIANTYDHRAATLGKHSLAPRADVSALLALLRSELGLRVTDACPMDGGWEGLVQFSFYEDRAECWF